ncbi:Arc family DNA-binding protein [Roseivivax halotolerans]|uniref:Arc family DNA-binding protein n=1 Tax=Roseivivax halotolerans TaxID=93684 RepID=UPI0031834B07
MRSRMPSGRRSMNLSTSVRCSLSAMLANGHHFLLDTMASIGLHSVTWTYQEVIMATRKPFQLRIPEDLKAWIEDQANKNGSSMNSEIVRALRERAERIEPA